jgi:hypothetical protein
MTTENYKYQPLNQYENTLAEEWFTPENRKRVVAMAIYEWRRRHGTKPIILIDHVDWAMCEVVDKNVWEQNYKIPNLRILAAERLLERMSETDYNYWLDYYDTQARLRDQEVPIPCGSHFQDKQYYKSPNIL